MGAHPPSPVFSSQAAEFSLDPTAVLSSSGSLHTIFERLAEFAFGAFSRVSRSETPTSHHGISRSEFSSCQTLNHESEETLFFFYSTRLKPGAFQPPSVTPRGTRGAHGAFVHSSTHCSLSSCVHEVLSLGPAFLASAMGFRPFPSLSPPRALHCAELGGAPRTSAE